MFKIELPKSHVVTKGPRDKSWVASVTVSTEAFTPDIVAKLAMHGLQQKIADAASGATNHDEALAAMQKAADAIVKGEWSSRGVGTGADERTLVARSIVRAAMKAKLGGASPEWAAFTGLDPAAQLAKLDAIAAANEAIFADAIDAKMAERAAEREQRKTLAGAADFNI